MVYEKNWTFDLNKIPASQTDLTDQCRSFWFEFKSFLTGASWTITQSCDSTQVQNSDTWSARSNIVASTGAHSWIVFKSPEGFSPGLNGSYAGDQSRVWISISFDYAAYYQVIIRLHTIAPSGGTTTVSPSSANQISYSSQQFNRSALNTNAKFHFAKTSESNFFVMLSYLGAGFLSFFFGLLKIVDLKEIESSGLDYPQSNVAICGWADSGTGPLTWTSLGSVSSTMVQGFAIDEAQASFNLNALANQGGLLGSNFPASGGNINGTHPKSPIFITCNGTNKMDVIGRLVDFEAGGNPTPQSAVDAANPTQVRIGNLWLPADDVITI